MSSDTSSRNPRTGKAGAATPLYHSLKSRLYTDDVTARHAATSKSTSSKERHLRQEGEFIRGNVLCKDSHVPRPSLVPFAPLDKLLWVVDFLWSRNWHREMYVPKRKCHIEINDGLIYLVGYYRSGPCDCIH